MLEYTINSNQSWLQTDIANGNCTTEIDTVNISVNTTNLALGSHTCNIKINSNDGSETIPEFVVNLNVVENNSENKIQIIRPVSGKLYISDKEFFSIPFLQDISLIIGKITIETEIENIQSLSYIDFFVDDELKHSTDPGNLSWCFNEKTAGPHKIKVVAYDSSDVAVAEDVVDTIIYNYI